MRSVLYEIDPNGEIEILLVEPDTQQIDAKVMSSRPLPTSTDEGSENEGDGTGFFDEFETIMDGLDLEFFETKNPQSSDKQDLEIRMRVSSSHLILASPFFKNKCSKSRTSLRCPASSVSANWMPKL
ncbi:hypothetical protein ACHAPU_009327 [Fusarium lateritium]